ncbi:PAF-acetylhydrolase family member [Colletotrichum orchidophilum]|uniref:Putative phospholipase n=1 Tax=Colletotrichum orchidophilum TaxID=1209926 RepID=A0A1G4AUZ6_9PEZI|nr:PAF-acetylhydrolase family member [Colletotrichum orchidophilum]OHE92916.1 PAF-acetylhydrolase family member [Colletotrichum orchidophilum]
MVSRQFPAYKDVDVELEVQAESQDFENPDSPLPLLDDNDDAIRQSTRARINPESIMENAPKWMQTAQPWSYSLSQRIISALRPRLTIGYLSCVLIGLYVLYCILIQSPLLASRLQKYSGPFGVGAIDIEVPVRTPRNTSDSAFISNGKPAFTLETVLFTLYYPAEKGVRATGRHYWIPKPISLTAEGYAKAAHFNNFISRPIFTFALWALVGSIRIPAQVDVPLLPPTSRKGEEKLPVMVLSHGLASSRTGYTDYCGQLASRGVVVAAIEHRDRSGPGSVVTAKDGKKHNIMYLNKNEIKGGKEMKSDDFKSKQLDFRQAEIEEAIAVLQSLHAGKGTTVFKDNARKEGRGLAEWRNRLDFSQTIITGHSFGATGVLRALKRATSKENPAVGGIVLDPGKGSGRLNTDIDVPLLIIHSESWSKQSTPFFGRPHFDTVRDIARDVLKRVGSSWFLTSLKTGHPSITDAPLIEPLLLSWATGATIDVRQGVEEYVRVSMEFMNFLKNDKRDGVLSEGVTHEVYGKNTMTDEQRARVPKETTKYWQIHVAPPRED